MNRTPPNKLFSSNPDVSKPLEEQHVTVRKRKHDDDFSAALKDFASEIKSTLHTLKSEIQDDISKIKCDLESVLISDREKFNACFADIKSEINSIRQEYQGVKKSIQSLESSHSETLKQVKTLEKSLEFHSEKYDNYNKKVESLAVSSKTIEALESKIIVLTKDNALLQQEINHNNQRDRLLNLEIVGVPETKDENLYHIIIAIAKHAEITIASEDIKEVNRVTPRYKQQGRPKNIVVKMKTRLIKDNIISGIRKNPLMTKDLGMSSTVTARIYVNEHLTQYNKQLLRRCRETAKLRNYQFVWTKNGRILVKKNDTSQSMLIGQEADIAKMV